MTIGSVCSAIVFTMALGSTLAVFGSDDAGRASTQDELADLRFEVVMPVVTPTPNARDINRYLVEFDGNGKFTKQHHGRRPN